LCGDGSLPRPGLVCALCGVDALVPRTKLRLAVCGSNEVYDGKANRARAIGMVIGIVVLVVALLCKRLLR
jgi:hypothetical protein